MKKIALLLFLFNWFFVSLIAQTYIPFSDSTSYWTVFKTDSITLMNYKVCYNIENKDTIIGQFSYHPIHLTDSFNNIYQSIGAIRNDSINKKVFYYDYNLNIDTLLYDFNLSIGDTLKESYTHSLNDTLIVDSIDFINLNGNNHKIYFLKWPSYPFKIHYSIIEGIGSTYGLFEKMFGQKWHFNNNIGDTLYCFKYLQNYSVYDHGMLHYNQPVSTCELVNNISDNYPQKEIINLYPNPLTENSKLHFNYKNFNKKHITIYNICGQVVKEYSTTNNVLNLNKKDFKKGIYSLQSISTDNRHHHIKFIVK